MRGTIKMSVANPVRDKIWISFPEDFATWVYLYYEKIGRICTFCGQLFHSVQHCDTRNNLLISRQSLNIQLDQIPAVRFGQWMKKIEHIPASNSELSSKSSDSAFSLFPILSSSGYRSRHNKECKIKPRLFWVLTLFLFKLKKISCQMLQCKSTGEITQVRFQKGSKGRANSLFIFLMPIALLFTLHT